MLCFVMSQCSLGSSPRPYLSSKPARYQTWQRALLTDVSVEIRALLAATACICFTQFGKKFTRYIWTAGQAGWQQLFISVLREGLAEQETHSRDQLADMGNQVAFATFT